IWENDGIALYAQIMEELEKQGITWKKNTVITLLSRLIEKQILKTNKIGRRNEYKAVISMEEYQASQMKTFVDKVYEGNVAGLVSTLIQQNMISQKDYDELMEFWEEGREKG
ncbi:MAG: BlaI/MecI/CopY family transcriptional regulator, partial [Planctomycetia bacterium]|nr:BlaI/MecI/CopY family transcriptional regulator [Planctomycetia bacterium]